MKNPLQGRSVGGTMDSSESVTGELSGSFGSSKDGRMVV